MFPVAARVCLWIALLYPGLLVACVWSWVAGDCLENSWKQHMGLSKGFVMQPKFLAPSNSSQMINGAGSMLQIQRFPKVISKTFWISLVLDMEGADVCKKFCINICWTWQLSSLSSSSVFNMVEVISLCCFSIELVRTHDLTNSCGFSPPSSGGKNAPALSVMRETTLMLALCWCHFFVYELRICIATYS